MAFIGAPPGQASPVRGGPYRFEEVDLHGVLLRADRARLQAFVDEALNGGAEGQPFTVLSPDVLVVANSQGRAQVSSNPDIGFDRVNEMAFFVLLFDCERQRIVNHPAYVYVDNGQSIALGREVYGYSKKLGSICFEPTPEDARGFSLGARGARAPRMAWEDLRLLEVELGEAAGLEQPGVFERTLVNVIAESARVLAHPPECLACLDTLGLTDLSRSILWKQGLQPDWKLPTISQLVEASYGLGDVEAVRLRDPGGTTVRFHDAFTEPVRSSLGLRSEYASGDGVVLAFSLRCEFTLEPGRVLREVQDHIAVEPKRVAVVGGGLAGLVAASLLAEHRSLEVHLLEASDRAGGKTAGWRRDGLSYEHGIHGVWSNYHNFRAFLERKGFDLARLLVDSDDSWLVQSDGRREPKVLAKPPHWPAPFHVVKQLLVSTVARVGDVLSLPGSLRIFDRSGYGALEGVSARAFFGEQGVSRSMYDGVLDPIIRNVMFDAPARVAAGSVLSALRFYFLGSGEAFQTRWFSGNLGERLIEPLVLTAFGEEQDPRRERLHLGSRVTALAVESGRVVAVEHGGGGGAPLLRIPKAEVGAQWRPFGDPPVFARATPAGFEAISSVCTHQGCIVRWRPARSLFSCPCHGATFDATGGNPTLPASRPLDRFTVSVDGDALVIDSPGGDSERLSVDFVVLAADVKGFRDLVSPGRSPEVAGLPDMERARNLGTVVHVVCRLVFKRRYLTIPESGILAGLDYVDNFFLVSRFQNDTGWTQGSVIEVQCYDVDGLVPLADAEVLRRVTADLARPFPEVSPEDLDVERSEVSRDQSFTRFAPGDQGRRPSVRTQLPNLFLAGDWVDVDRECWFMERAVVAGTMAANEVLATCGLPIRPLLRAEVEAGYSLVERAASLGGLARQTLRRLARSREIV